MPSPKLEPLVLTAQERQVLEGAWRRKTLQVLASRSQIVLASADGPSVTVGPGARKITDEQVELVITKTLEEREPGEDTHWSTRSVAAATRMSQSAVSRIWRAFGLKPHLVQT